MDSSIDGTEVGSTKAGSQGAGLVQPNELSTPSETTWIDGFSDEDKAFVQNKGYESPEDLLKGYRNLNTHMGADEKNIMRFPNDGEPMDDIHMRLGRPKTVEEYSFTPVDGFEGGDRLNTIRDIAFKAGVSGEGFKAIIDEFVSGEINQLQETEKDVIENRDIEIMTMKAEWGKDYQKRVNNADSAVRAMGVSEEMRNSFRDAVGVRQSVEFFENIFKLTGEDTIADALGEVSTENTIEQMNAEIESIKLEIGSDRDKRNEYWKKGKIYQRHQTLQKTINSLMQSD